MNKIFGILALICVLAVAGMAAASTPQAGKPVHDIYEKAAELSFGKGLRHADRAADGSVMDTHI